jgi:hypothetical protein
MDWKFSRDMQREQSKSPVIVPVDDWKELKKKISRIEQYDFGFPFLLGLMVGIAVVAAIGFFTLRDMSNFEVASSNVTVHAGHATVHSSIAAVNAFKINDSLSTAAIYANRRYELLYVYGAVCLAGVTGLAVSIYYGKKQKKMTSSCKRDILEEMDKQEKMLKE